MIQRQCWYQWMWTPAIRRITQVNNGQTQSQRVNRKLVVNLELAMNIKQEGRVPAHTKLELHPLYRQEEVCQHQEQQGELHQQRPKGNGEFHQLLSNKAGEEIGKRGCDQHAELTCHRPLLKAFKKTMHRHNQEQAHIHHHHRHALQVESAQVEVKT